MSTLRQIVYNSVISLHRRTEKEWISLKEICEEIDRVRNANINNSVASVRAALEKLNLKPKTFSGTEKYILKEKESELYKSFYYDNLKLIENINIGEVFTRDKLMELFKISGQSGMMKTNTFYSLVLITSEDNNIYGDSLVENGTIQYTGEGLKGDQTMTKNNKTLYESKDNDLPVYLFSKDKNRNYIFEGQVELYDEPYQVEEADIDDKKRLVWKFPLRVIYLDEYEYKNDEKYHQLVDDIAKIENNYTINGDSELNELVFKEGKLNIRKNKKTDRKVSRSAKPDYIAAEIIKTKQGIKNEKDVYASEIKRLRKEGATEQIKLMEVFFKNKKDNEGFDILSFELNKNGKYVEKYIEVKSTKGNEGTPIDITADEIEFAKDHINNYYLYRVINLLI